ncbi:MAG: hypothetical protein HQM16_16390 [Deltaproteobacteria bacterium]|nr:hypothetical protein [Deltaproteobacteria bacterium]
MTLSCLFAHKLCAIADRKKMANRDLYDAWQNMDWLDTC